MEKYEKIRKAWKEYLIAALSLELGLDPILDHLNIIFQEFYGSDSDRHFKFNNTQYRFAWSIANDSKSTMDIGEAIPIKISIVSEDETECQDFLDYITKHMPEDGLLLLQKAAFKLL